ncbi:MAG TPA: IclR family transcriptional regulator, partial [Eubacteriaceae bacterium]|nr:IclR family transcriptional regulator [Eubacteriaceae bacterium]
SYLDQYVFNKELIKLTDKTITSRKELLKELEKVRREQYSIDNEEIEIGLRCVAAPILDHNGYPVAAISISGPAARLTSDIIEKAAQDVRQQARQISYRMGYTK